MSLEKGITIFTPTYNRAYCISKLYESLCAQTNKCFQWIVVDDGSTDNTAELFRQWQTDGVIPIIYYHQPNAGKQVPTIRASSWQRENCLPV